MLLLVTDEFMNVHIELIKCIDALHCSRYNFLKTSCDFLKEEAKNNIIQQNRK